MAGFYAGLLAVEAGWIVAALNAEEAGGARQRGILVVELSEDENAGFQADLQGDVWVHVEWGDALGEIVGGMGRNEGKAEIDRLDVGKGAVVPATDLVLRALGVFGANGFGGIVVCRLNVRRVVGATATGE